MTVIRNNSKTDLLQQDHCFYRDKKIIPPPDSKNDLILPKSPCESPLTPDTIIASNEERLIEANELFFLAVILKSVPAFFTESLLNAGKCNFCKIIIALFCSRHQDI